MLPYQANSDIAMIYVLKAQLQDAPPAAIRGALTMVPWYMGSGFLYRAIAFYQIVFCSVLLR